MGWPCWSQTCSKMEVACRLTILRQKKNLEQIGWSCCSQFQFNIFCTNCTETGKKLGTNRLILLATDSFKGGNSFCTDCTETEKKLETNGLVSLVSVSFKDGNLFNPSWIIQ